jgi:hypothetical protein
MLNNDATGLYQWLAIGEGEDLDAGNGSVWNGLGNPTVSRDAGAGGKGQEMIRTMRIARGVESYGAHGTGARGVGRIDVFENLREGAEFNPHGVVVRGTDTENDGGRAQNG